MKKSTPLFSILAVLILSFLLSACGGQTFASWAGVTKNEERIYLAFNQFVYAINTANGGLVWRFPAEEPLRDTTFYAPPALTPQGQVIVGSFAHGSTPGKLFSLDAESGELQWVFEQATFHYIAKPLTTETGIYAPNADGTLYALDFDGNLRWKFSTDRAIWASPATNAQCTCIYVASMDHHLYSLEAQSGELNWKTADLGGALAAPPAFGEAGVLYIGTSGNQLLALDAESGETLWAYSTEGWVWSEAVVHQGKIYFGDLEGYLYALNAEDGSQLWKVKVEGAALNRLLVHNQRVYYTTDTTTFGALNLDGSPVWKLEATAKVYAPMLAEGDTLLVATTDLETPLIAYNEEGEQKWSFTIPKQ